MPQYFSPGVYVEEVDPGPRPIQGVSTSVTGAVGVTSRGPSSGKPVLVTSYTEFVRIFGAPLVEPSAMVPPNAGLQNKWALDQAEGGRWWQFALGVKGFFDNGGEQLFVKRVFSSGASRARATLGRGVISELTRDEDASSNTLRLRHLLGIDASTQLNVFSNGQPLSGNPFTVTAYNASGEVTLNAAVGQELLAGRDFVEIVGADRQPARPNQEITVEAYSVGDWGGTTPPVPGNGLSARIRPMVGNTLRIMADPVQGGAAASTTLSSSVAVGPNPIPVDDTTGFAVNDHVVIQGTEFVINTVTAGAPGSFVVNKPVPTGGFAAGTSVKSLRQANAAGVNTINVRGASGLYVNALVELDNRTNKERFLVDSVDGTQVTLSGNLANVFYENHPLRVIEAEVTARYRRDGEIELEESFTNLRLADDGGFSDIVRQVNDRSNLIRLRRGAAFPARGPSNLADFPSVPSSTPELHLANLTGGSDNYNALTVDDFVGVDRGSGNRTGVQALEDIEDISLVVVSGMWAGTIRDAVIRHCDAMRYRFAILDPPNDLDIQEIRAFRAPIDTRFAALYYPWIIVRNAAQQRFETIGPSAHMAGIYARVDRERGFHKAPAGNAPRRQRQSQGVGGTDQWRISNHKGGSHDR